MGEATYVTSKLAIIQITLVDHQLTLLQVLIQIPRILDKWQPPKAIRLRPEPVRPYAQSTVRVKASQAFEQAFKSLLIILRQLGSSLRWRRVMGFRFRRCEKRLWIL